MPPQKFNSSNKFSQAQIGGLTYYKGAPEDYSRRLTVIWELTGSSIRWICPVSISESILWQKAMRVIAFGYSEEPLQENCISGNLVLIGLAAIRDDVRPEAHITIHDVQKRVFR